MNESVDFHIVLLESVIAMGSNIMLLANSMSRSVMTARFSPMPR